MAGDIHKFLNTFQPPKPGVYKDSVANSCEMALQLNNPSYFFFLQPTFQAKTNTVLVRKIFGGDNVIANVAVGDDDASSSSKVPPKVQDPSSGIKASVGGTPSHTIPTAPGVPKTPANPTRMTTIDLPPVQATPSSELGRLDLQAQFTLLIFPDFKGRPVPFSNGAFDANDFCPTAHPFLYDLIFSVRKNPHAKASTFLLKEILIDIPHEGGYIIRPHDEALLLEDYDGPGARMLSNQRFVIFLNRTSRFITARLIPRSAFDNLVLPINDVRTNEVSFRLAEPYIAPIKNEIGVRVRTDGVVKKRPRAQVSVMMYERYQTPSGEKIVSSQWFVVKKDNLKPDP